MPGSRKVWRKKPALVPHGGLPQMTRWRRIVLIALGLVLAATFAALRESAPPAPAPIPQEQGAPAPRAFDGPLWSSAGAGARANAEHHWRKHGREFPELKDADAYIRAAHAFINHPPPGTLTKQERDGDTLFYDPKTNTFAVRARNGAPRTMFRPDDGMRYWNRQ